MIAESPARADSSVNSTAGALEVALLTGGQDPHYALGLVTALANAGVRLDVVGNDLVDNPKMHATAGIRFVDLYGSKSAAGIVFKVAKTLLSYARLLQYTATAKARTFHILWGNKFDLADRTLLMFYYKMLGKAVVLTAHNVNAGRRDGRDSLLNRLTLRIQYQCADHIFVHTPKMRDELVERFRVKADAVTVIPYGINNAVPDSHLTSPEAKRRLRLRTTDKTMLFFGAIKSYKGLEYLVEAFQKLDGIDPLYRLIIAGEQKKGHKEYWRRIERAIDGHPSRARILQKIEFIGDEEVEQYFRAADVAILPYTEIFQSGILFLAYAYGVPVIATDVGSFSEDIVEGRTGYSCRPRNPDDLAATIQRYFESELYKQLEHRHQEIRDYVLSRHSWDIVADRTRGVYSRVLGRA